MNRGAFSRGGALALVAGGFALFLAMIWLIGAGANVAGERGAGQGHASANGLNGYSGLVRLVEAQGYTIDRSRSGEGLNTTGLLVLTPPNFADAEEIGEILEKRVYTGPTLVIMPKWFATRPSRQLPAETRAKFKRDWVTLQGYVPSGWAEDLPVPYGFKHKAFPGGELADIVMTANPAAPPAAPEAGEPEAKEEPEKAAKPGTWSGMGLSGVLPAPSTLYAVPDTPQDILIEDAEQRALAIIVRPGEGSAIEDSTYPVIFLAEPDLANNYGLADPRRAAAAIALVDELTYEEDIDHVTFDMTLNGFGASENLFTLAFRPPFLAATLSLLVALLIVGWRAFMRFGPAAADGGPGIAFGKRQLIANGAGLIVRARRFALLGAPYAALSARRLAERLGLARPDPAAIDAALARRLPSEEPYTRRAARMEAAEKPADLLAAAQSLDDLATKLTQGPK